MFMPVRALMTAAPPSSSMDVTRMLVKMQKKKKVMCAARPQRASAAGVHSRGLRQQLPCASRTHA
jgi:hypothetical protein